MRKRFLIVVGLPKSGTTFLYAETARRRDVFAMPRGNKEVDYFRLGRDPEAYQALFDDDAAGDRVCVDASPLYIDDVVRSADNIRAALAGHEVRIVVCLRDPLERAYSHYLHDAARGYSAFGHSDHAFWAPPVLARYLLPVAPRVRHLQEVFGAENVWGFALSADPAPFEARLRGFAGLGPDWRLDLGHNPLPGFALPQAVYNAEADSEVVLAGGRYRLPKGQFLVIGRDKSLLVPRIDPALAGQLMAHHATLTRHCDTGLLPQAARARITGDMAEAAALMGLDLPIDPGPRVMVARQMDEVPPAILAQLPFLGPLETPVAQIMDAGLTPTARTTVTVPHTGVSLARDMARVQLMMARDPLEPQPADALMAEILARHGPVHRYVMALLRWHLARRQYDAALEVLRAYYPPDRQLQPVRIDRILQKRGLTPPEEILRAFEAAGARVRPDGAS